MAKIYVPTIPSGSQCATWVNNNTLRVYDNRYTNTWVNYIEYYTDNHYNYSYGSSYIGNTFNYYCINNNDFSNDYLFRNDLVDILLIFVFIVIFFIYFPYKIVSRAFGRWFKI